MSTVRLALALWLPVAFLVACDSSTPAPEGAAPDAAPEAAESAEEVPAPEVAPSWWGGEIHTTETFGYGKYEAKLQPSTGQGSITGFFNLCYSNDTFSECIDYTSVGAQHLELDMEFTPTGNDPSSRRWISSCLTDEDCTVSHPQPAPRTDGNLQAVSFNSYPTDNQTYYTAPFDPYSSINTYSITFLPTEITWSVNGTDILSRVPTATNPLRVDTAGQTFSTVADNNLIKMVVNLWDGSEGGAGGFGGPSNTQQTSGNPALVQSVGFYPATCSGTSCTVSDTPSYLSDFATPQFIKNSQDITAQVTPSNVCAGDGDSNAMWSVITRDQFPVYVSPSHVNCDYTGSSTISLSFTSSMNAAE